MTIADDNTFVSKDQSGGFEGKGVLYGKPGCWDVIRFNDANISITKEKFVGSYIFLSTGMRAMKTWFDAGSTEPKYFTSQDGKYISETDFNYLLKNPKALPDFWKKN